MSTTQTDINQASWKVHEKILVRVFFLLTLLLTIPVNPLQFIQSATSLGVDNRYYFGSFLSRGNSERDFTWIFITIFILLVISIIWEFLDKKHKEYNLLFYWTWVLARFKVADIMFWFGLEKAFPIQMPFPTLSYLNTNLGDIHLWKLYWLNTGASPAFEVFCGLFEVAAAVLLLFRRTATLGAIAMLSITVPIVAVNFTYDAGVQKPATLILILILGILAYDYKALWNFWVLRKKATLRKAPDVFNLKWQKIAKYSAFTLFIISAVILRAIGMYDWYKKGESSKLPNTKGVEKFYGFYRVPEFYINNKEHPYSYTDSLRWQDVVFEKWNTISIKTAKPILLKEVRRGRRSFQEVLGVAGRHYYSYKADTVAQTLSLKYKSDTTQQFHFKYHYTNDTTLSLSGINEKGDSVKVILNKTNKKYPLVEGRSKNQVYVP